MNIIKFPSALTIALLCLSSSVFAEQVQYIPADEIDAGTIYPDIWPNGTGYISNPDYDNSISDLPMYTNEGAGIVMVVDPAVGNAGQFWNCGRLAGGVDNDYSVDRCLAMAYRVDHKDGIARLIDDITPGGSYVLSVDGASPYSLVLSYSYTDTNGTLKNSESYDPSDPVTSDSTWVNIEYEFTVPDDMDDNQPFKVIIYTTSETEANWADHNYRTLFANNFSLMGPPVPVVAVQYFPEDELETITGFGPAPDGGYVGIPADNRGLHLDDGTDTYGSTDGEAYPRYMNGDRTQLEGGYSAVAPDGHDGNYIYLNQWRTKHSVGIYREVEGIEPGAKYTVSADGATLGSLLWDYSYTKVGEETPTTVTLTNTVLSNYDWVNVEETFKTPDDIDTTKSFKVTLRTLGATPGTITKDESQLWAANFSLISVLTESITVAPSHIQMNLLSLNSSTVVVTNSGEKPLTISTIDAGSFWLDDVDGEVDCVGATLSENSNCTFIVQSFDPDNNTTKTTATHGVVTINTDNSDTPAYPIFITLNAETAAEQAARRVSSIVNNIVITDDQTTNPLIGYPQTGQDYTFTFDLDGYDTDSLLGVALFECSAPIVKNNCAKSLTDKLVSAPAVAGATATGGFSYLTETTGLRSYSATITMPDMDATKNLVMRLYYKSAKDNDVGNNWISAIIPSGQGLTYVDGLGRKVVIADAIGGE